MWPFLANMLCRVRDLLRDFFSSLSIDDRPLLSSTGAFLSSVSSLYLSL